MHFDIDNFRKSPIRSQREIISTWKEFTPIVSIICTTYNQEDYIEDAIRGFLHQHTDFAFEIIIHDDASTDKTKEIINKYKNNYPEIIKPILQKKNQYSKAPNSPLSISFSQSKGKYIAICEGDDFWIDSRKLQIQKTLLEENHKYSIIVHNGYKLYPNRLSLVFSKINRPSIFTALDVVKKNSQFAPTASYFFRRQTISHLPNWFDSAPIGDLFIEIYSTKSGAGLFLPDKLCVYRVNAINSWSARISASNQLKSTTLQQIIDSLQKTAKDFPEIKAAINSRIIEIQRLRAIDKFTKSSNNNLKSHPSEEYKNLRNKLKKLTPISTISFQIAFPPSFFLFIALNSARIHTRSKLVYIYKYLKALKLI